MGNQLRSPTNIGHLSLSDNSTDDYLYINGVPITDGGVQLYRHVFSTVDFPGRFIYFVSAQSTQYSSVTIAVRDSVSPLKIFYGGPFEEAEDFYELLCVGASLYTYEYDVETGDLRFVDTNIQNETINSQDYTITPL